MASPVKVWRNQKKITAVLGKTGTIVSWTVVRVPPAGFSDQAPYPVVVVQFATGDRVSAQLVDYADADLAIGTRVVAIIRRTTRPDLDGIIPYGIKVKPERG